MVTLVSGVDDAVRANSNGGYLREPRITGEKSLLVAAVVCW